MKQGAIFNRSRAARPLLKALMLTTCLVGVSPAFAQAAPGADDQSEASHGNDQKPADIVVTGSQVARRGFDSPTPTIMLNLDDLERTGSTNIADAINDVPALQTAITPTTVTNLSAVAGGHFSDLRALGYTRTLTLIDGRRYVPSTVTGMVSLNAVPQALVGGVDIVTGGASAAYGSDAVAGVVNLKIDRNLKGFRATLQGGISDYNDYRNYRFSIAYGKSFAGGRGKLLIGAETAANSGIARISDRPWGRGPGVILNPNYTSTNGQPRNLFVDDARASNVASGGVINSPSLLKGIQFGPGGTPMPFTYGTLVSSNGMKGGDGILKTGEAVLSTPQNRWSVMAQLNYEVANNLTAYATLNYSRSWFLEDSVVGSDQITIQADNAYLAPSIASVMASNNIASFVMGRDITDYARGKIGQWAHTVQGVLGLKGDLGHSWSFDLSYSGGHTENRTLFTGDRITGNWRQAVDAVVDPANGSIVCRSTLTDPTNGCIPLNLFGVGSASQQAINYITGTSVRDWNIDQHVVDGVIRGTPFSTWAGDVSLAVGGEWRRQSVDVTSDPLSVQRIFRVGNTIPFTGAVSVKEGFGEVVVPLVRDAGWARLIEVDLAGRVTDYSTSGTVETWKAGLNYKINSSIRLRATRSRDIRAPNLNELYSQGATLGARISDPGYGSYAIIYVTSGNPNLTPEKSDTLTAGVVLTPTFLKRLALSVDYSHIRVSDVLGTLTLNSTIERCNAGVATLCSLITRDPTTHLITNILQAPANFQELVTDSVDVETDYRFKAFNGNINLHGMATWTPRLELNDQGVVSKYAGHIIGGALDGAGPRSHWRATGSVGYSNRTWKLSLTGRYVSGGLLSSTYSTYNGASIDGQAYVDIFGSVYLLKTKTNRLQIFGVIRNALNNSPPIVGGDYGSARRFFDLIGRQYTVGLRTKF